MRRYGLEIPCLFIHLWNSFIHSCISPVTDSRVYCIIHGLRNDHRQADKQVDGLLCLCLTTTTTIIIIIVIIVIPFRFRNSWPA